MDSPLEHSQWKPFGLSGVCRGRVSRVFPSSRPLSHQTQRDLQAQINSFVFVLRSSWHFLSCSEKYVVSTATGSIKCHAQVGLQLYTIFFSHLSRSLDNSFCTYRLLCQRSCLFPRMQRKSRGIGSRDAISLLSFHFLFWEVSLICFLTTWLQGHKPSNLRSPDSKRVYIS